MKSIPIAKEKDKIDGWVIDKNFIEIMWRNMTFKIERVDIEEFLLILVRCGYLELIT